MYFRCLCAYRRIHFVLTIYPTFYRSDGHGDLRDYESMHRDRLHLLQILIENEIGHLSVWQNALGEPSRAHNSGADRSTVRVFYLFFC